MHSGSLKQQLHPSRNANGGLDFLTILKFKPFRHKPGTFHRAAPSPQEEETDHGRRGWAAVAEYHRCGDLGFSLRDVARKLNGSEKPSRPTAARRSLSSSMTA
jgi:hypothetical protein